MKRLSRFQLHSLLVKEEYNLLYDQCLEHGTVVYDKERTIHGVHFHFIGVVHYNDNWLFEFSNGVLARVTLTEGKE